MSSGRRRINRPSPPVGAHDKGYTPSTAQLAELVASLQDTVKDLKADVLILSRKMVSLEAELDHVQGKRGL